MRHRVVFILRACLWDSAVDSFLGARTPTSKLWLCCCGSEGVPHAAESEYVAGSASHSCLMVGCVVLYVSVELRGSRQMQKQVLKMLFAVQNIFFSQFWTATRIPTLKQLACMRLCENGSFHAICWTFLNTKTLDPECVRRIWVCVCHFLPTPTQMQPFCQSCHDAHRCRNASSTNGTGQQEHFEPKGINLFTSLCYVGMCNFVPLEKSSCFRSNFLGRASETFFPETLSNLSSSGPSCKYSWNVQ